MANNMLEQAIVDAEALREAAVKNAETLVLEKFSGQIKNAVESLLEQDDPTGLEDLNLSDNPMSSVDSAAPDLDEVDPQQSSVMEHIPNAATTQTDEDIEIPLDALLEQMRVLNQEINFDGDSILDEELELALEADDDLLVDEDEISDSDATEDAEVVDLDEELFSEEEELTEEYIDLDEDLDLAEIVERLVVDNVPQKSGWAGTPASQISIAEEELLALEQDSEVREEKAALRKAVKELENVNEGISNEKEHLQESLHEAKDMILTLRDTVLALKEKLDSSSLTNAKLLYQNKALNSDSLNERQKEKLVEAISCADTIDEAKVIFETLQSTVGSTSRKKQPKSLGEAVEKSSSFVLSARRNSARQNKKDDPTLQRWKFLAGIDKNK